MAAPGEGGSGGVPVSVRGDEARTSENSIHLTSLLEGPVLTPRKDSLCVVEVVETT